MTDDLYQEIILEEYAHPQNMGSLEDPDVQITESNSSCGDQVTIFLNYDPQLKQVTEIKWQGTGCAISVALASLLSQSLQHKTLQEIKVLQKKDLEEMVGIEQISFGREKCLTLALIALQKAADQLLAKSTSFSTATKK